MNNIGVSDEHPTNNSLAGSSSEKKKTEKNLALIISECSVEITTTENYLKRLQNLRKELTYISETDWLFEPLDK